MFFKIKPQPGLSKAKARTFRQSQPEHVDGGKAKGGDVYHTVTFTLLEFDQNGNGSGVIHKFRKKKTGNVANVSSKT